MKNAWTVIETSNRKESPDVVCEGTIVDENLECHPTESVVVHILTKSDLIELDNFYFDGGSGPVSSESEALEDVKHLLLSESGDDGVCGHGHVEKDAFSTDLATRDGGYNPTAPECSF